VIGFGSLLEIHSVRLDVATSVTVGPRIIVLEVTQGGDVIRSISLGSISDDDTAVFDAAPGLDLALPLNLWLLPGQVLHIRDKTGVDPTADDILIRMTGKIR
jgi:hypothetical protein